MRAEIAPAGATVARSVRDAAQRKVPNVIVVGKREEAAGSTTLRQHGSDSQATLSVDTLERALLAAIEHRHRRVDLAGSETGVSR